MHNHTANSCVVSHLVELRLISAILLTGAGRATQPDIPLGVPPGSEPGLSTLPQARDLSAGGLFPKYAVHNIYALLSRINNLAHEMRVSAFQNAVVTA